MDTLAKVNDMAELNIDSALVRNASILQKEEKWLRCKMDAFAAILEKTCWWKFTTLLNKEHLTILSLSRLV